MATENQQTAAEQLAKIEAILQQQLSGGELTLSTELPGLEALQPVFAYLFDLPGLQLSNTTLKGGEQLAANGSANLYGLAAIPTQVDFALRDERILFTLTAKFPEAVRLALPGVSGFAVKDLHLSGATFLDDRLLRVYIDGTLQLKETEIPIRLQLPSVSEDWTLTSSLAVKLPRLSDLAALLGDELLAWVPEALEQVGAFELRDLQLVFRPGSGSVELLSARLQPAEGAAGWSLIPGQLLLRKPALEVGVAQLTDAARRNAFGSISGILALGDIDLQLAAGKFSADEPWVFRGGLLPGESFGLHGAVKQLLPAEAVLPDEIPDCRFSDLAFEVAAQTGEFSLQATAIGAWSIPLGFGQLQIKNAHLSLGKTATAGEAETAATCQVSGVGTLRLQLTEGVAAEFSGSVQLKADRQGVGFTFSADQSGNNQLRIDIPTGVGSQNPAVEFSFSELAIAHSRDGWRVQADATTRFSGLPAFLTAPIPGTELALVPQEPRVWSFNAGGGEVAFSIDRLWEGECPRLPLPSIRIGGAELALGILWLDARQWTIRFGQQSTSAAKIALQTTLQVAVSDEINRLFGVGADGQPRTRIFRTFTSGVTDPSSSATGIQLDLSEKGISALLEGSPLNAMQPDAQGFYDLSLGADGQFGKLRTRMPEFRFDGSGWVAAGEWHIEKPLKLPLFPLKEALSQAGLGPLAGVLPAGVPLDDIRLLDENNRLVFGPWLDRLAKQTELSLPQELIEALKTLEESAEQLLEQTPGRFNEYLNFQMPPDLAFALEVRAGGGLKLDLSTRASEDGAPVPLKLLLPFVDPATGIPELLGVELVSLSFGEILGGSLFLLELEGKFDRFDLISMALCLTTGHLADGKTSSRRFLRSYNIDRLLAVIPAATPVPVPLFYREIGVSYYGWEMLQFESHWHFPLPEVGLFGALDLFSQLKDFFCEKDVRLSPDAPPEGFRLPFTIGPNYLRLPPYLGGKMIGSDQPLPEWSVWSSLASLLNGLKTGRPRDFLQALPVEARIGSVAVDLGPFSASAGAAVTTPHEFQTAILGGQARTEAGQAFGERLQAWGAGPEQQLMTLLPKRNEQPTAADGLIILLLAEFAVSGVAALQASFGLAAIGSKGFGTGVRLAGSIGEAFRVAIQGSLLVEPNRLRVEGDTGIWWNDERLTNLGLVTDISPASLITEVTLALTPECDFSGSWAVSKEAMRIGGKIRWDYGGNAPLSAAGSADFTSEGLSLTLTQLDSAVLHGIQLEKFTAFLPAAPGQPLVGTLALAIPEELSGALRAEIDAAARQAKSQLDNARQLTMQQLDALKGYAVSVAGIRLLLIAICNAAVNAINSAVGNLPAKKTYGRWPFRKTIKVRAEASREVAPYIRALQGFARTFANSSTRTLATDVVALLNWALKNRLHTVKRYGVTVARVPVLSDQTVAKLQSINANVPAWLAHLPEHDAGLTLSGTMIDFAQGTVNAALRDIADTLDQTSSNIPALTGLTVQSDLTLVPSSEVKAQMEVARNNRVKVYTLLLNFDDPAAGAKDLYDLVAKDLGSAL